jgi:AmmeMemoRadiSam system protein A
MENKIHPVVQLAKQAVENYVQKGKSLKPEMLDPIMKERAGVFVSIKKRGALRGCVGTFAPTQPNIAEEIVHNAISSASSDPRFSPVNSTELDDLEYSVDILTSPELVDSKDQLDPEKYGIVVEAGFRRGLLLPDLEGVDTVDEQIDICRAKAGIGANEPVKLYRFSVRRYK